MRIRFNQTGAGMLEEHVLMKRIEYVQTKRKIQQFSTFLPDEILQLHGSDQMMKQIHYFVGVLLCVDISGIIQLIERYYKGGLGELYKMSVNLNAYIGSIIEVLRFYGGDVLTIFSNSFITLWKVQPEQSMYEILHTVVVCANVIQKLLGVYDTQVNVPLKLKTAVSCGNVALAITQHDLVRQPIIFGDAFDSLKKCVKSAKFGDVLVTENAWPHMLQERYTVSKINNTFIKIIKISYKSNEVARKAFFDDKYVNVVNLIEKHYQQRNMLRSMILSTRLLTNTKMMDKFIKQLPRRVELRIASRYWNVDTMKPFLNEVVFVQITESQPAEYLTELREVTTMHFKIVPAIVDTTDLVDLVNDIVEVVTENMKRHYATIHHVFLTEEGVMITIIFGLVLINHENESLNALMYAYKVKAHLDEWPAVASASAGISSGIVYCSVIGHPLRREYAVIGRPVARAKYLSFQYSSQVTCDYKIFNTSKLSSLYFKVLNNSQEMSLNEMIFEYNEGFDSTEERLATRPLIDRMSDYNLLISMIHDPAAVGVSGICLEGPDMIGKTSIMLQVFESAGSHNYNTIYLELQESTSFPYYCACELYSLIFDSIHVLSEIPESIEDLPRRLELFGTDPEVAEDVALEKYRVLNKFRDIVQLSVKTLVFFIDNIQYIDFQSWEIITLTFPFKNLRLILGGNLYKCPWNLRKRLHRNRDIRLKEVLPLKSRYIIPLTCSFFDVQAVSKRLIDLLIKTCDGIPGYIECSLLRLINNETIQLRFSNKEKIDWNEFACTNYAAIKKIETIFPVLDFCEKIDVNADDITMDLIYLDLFDSFTPFQQLVVKTASLIGEVVGRTMLVVTLNYPPDETLSECIKILFDEKVLECGSRYIAGKRSRTSTICCSCYFDADFFTTEKQTLPKYAYCKLLHFYNASFRNVAYNRIPDNQRHELHVLCAEVLEKMDHICPNCARDPSNFYVTFGKYKQFLEYCSDPSKQLHYYDIPQDSGTNVRQALNICKEEASNANMKMHRLKIDEKYIQMKRTTNQASCQCLAMMHVIYKDIIFHATKANEYGKMVFYKLKFGLVQLCMRDIFGAMNTLTEAREMALVNTGTKDTEIGDVFRQYHVGTSSIGLAMCHMKIKSIEPAKQNIILALRQYNVPTLVFSFKQFRFLLRRRHLKFRTIRGYKSKNFTFGWELSVALFICAKIFAMERSWDYARDCCDHSIALMSSINNNIPIIMDVYADAVDIYRKSGDNETCERLQKYIIAEFQARYARNTFYLHTWFDLMDVLIDVYVIRGEMKQAIRLGYRLMHIANFSNTSKLQPSVLLRLCELNMYTMYFRDFIDVFSILARSLSFNHKYGYLYYHFMALQIYMKTGFFIVNFQENVRFAKDYLYGKTSLTLTDMAFKSLIEIEYLRLGQLDRAKKWQVDDFDYASAQFSDYKVMRLMLIQMEGNLLRLRHQFLSAPEKEKGKLYKKIVDMFKSMKAVCKQNLMYKPIYLSLLAWFYMLDNKHTRGKHTLKKMYKVSKKTGNYYNMALAIRLRNYWDGGFTLGYKFRPQVSLDDAPGYKFDQFAQFLHPYMIL